ncbi:MAG: thioredoxin domain-containing protein [Tetrasphaera sp.]
MASKKTTAPSDASGARQAKIQQAAGKGRTGPSPVTIAGIVAILAIIAVVAWVIIANHNANDGKGEGGSALPAGVSAMGQPIERGTAKEGAPTLDIYEDFQCPGCHQLETILGPTVAEMAADGSAKVRYHVMNFLDERYPGENSTRAAIGSFCAAADGKFGAFHDTVYAAQPATEGQGWTDEQFKQIAKDAGLSGAAYTTWETCYTNQDMKQYATSMQAASAKDGVQSTPTVKLNGKVMDMANMTAETFKKAVLGG